MLMKKVKLFLACLLAVVSTALYAQNITVRGTVTDASTGEPIPGAAIVVQGNATSYALTDVQGAFSINAPRNAVLEVSNMGFRPQSVEVNGMTIVNIALEPDAEYLDEVVVTAQGLTRKQKAIGYSAQVISDEKLSLTHSSDMGNSLAGKVAGAQFWGAGGATFNEGSIILRGATSYSDAKGNEPIYVIDGTIATAAAVNMDDVESINILKGPSATALYGSRGANGAVIVTTKKAQEGTSSIEFSHTTAVETYYNHIKFNDLYGGGSGTSGLTKAVANAIAAGEDVTKIDWTSPKHLYEDFGDGTYVMDYYSDENWGARYDGTTLVRSALSFDPTSSKYNTADPWQARLNMSDLTRAAWSNTTNIAFSKSSKGMSTRVSFTNVDRQGVMYNSKAIRRSFSIASQLKPTEWLTADFSYRYRYRSNKNAATEGYSADGNVVCDFVQWGHTNVNIKDYMDWQRPDGTWRTWNIHSTDDLTAEYHDNPFATMYNYNSTTVFNYHLLSSDIYATLPLNFRLGVRLNNYILARQRDYKYGTGSKNWDSFFRTYHLQDNDFTAQGCLTWGDQFVDNPLTVEAAAFAEARRYDDWYLNSYTNGGLNVIDYYNLKASSSTYSTNNEEKHYKTRSFFGTATIGWDDLIYLDGSLRYDVDSRLPADNNGYLYGGASISFMASKLINAPWLNFWKIRASIAQVGSTIEEYQIYPTYTVGTKKNGQTTMYEPNTLKNEHVLPTISTSYEVGTEFKMFNNRFYGDINFYRKDTKNDIIDANELPQSGYSARKVNAGLVRNQGVEIMLGGTPVNTRDFTWNLSANWSKNNNMLIELTPDQHDYTIYWTRFYDAWYNKAIEGKPIGVISAASRIVRNDEGQLVLQEGNATWGDVRPTFERGVEKEVGNVQPKFTGGFSQDFRYKNWSLGMSLDYLVGGQLVSWTNMWGTGSGLFASTAKINDRGVNEREPVGIGGGVHLTGVDKDGNPMDGYVDAYSYYHNLANYSTDSWVYDRTYVKLRELSLRYDLPAQFLKNLGIGIRKASVAFVATNPWLIYSACPNIDPSEIAGVEYNYLEGGQAMSTRSFGLTVNITF